MVPNFLSDLNFNHDDSMEPEGSNINFDLLLLYL